MPVDEEQIEANRRYSYDQNPTYPTTDITTPSSS